MTDNLKDRPRLRSWPELRLCLRDTKDECPDYLCTMLQVLVKRFKFHVHVPLSLEKAKYTTPQRLLLH